MAVTRVHHVPNPDVVGVSTSSGQFLSFRVTAGGPRPSFRFSTDIKGILLNQGMFPTDPMATYEWAYLRDPSDIQQFELVTTALGFAANATYRYLVSLQGPGGPISDLLDIEYTGGPTDFEAETFRIVIV
jgi:hypothetical protein